MMDSTVILEVCVDSLRSAINAVNGGASRLEVCGNLGLGGGTTPSIGLIKSIQKLYPDIPLMAMVRPRVGDFLYTEDEVQVMLEDINTFGSLGIFGIVLGALRDNGQIDLETTRRLVDEALPMEVTFHRAIDMSHNILEELAELQTVAGITRVLTSGGGCSVRENTQTLKTLMEAVGRHNMIVLPGSGINSQTAPEILQTLLPVGLRELHSSCGIWVSSHMKYRKEGMGMGIDGGHEWEIRQTSQTSVANLCSVISDILAQRHVEEIRS